ncbi:MAG: hypothetical protein ACYCYM_08235 [Saccharofermentanales bacterium]
MERIGDFLTQDTYTDLISELMLLEVEEQTDGKDNKKRIDEIKTLLEIE